MELYKFGPVPAPRINATATYSQLKAHPELYYEVSLTIWLPQMRNL
jgi:hypothetical protein